MSSAGETTLPAEMIDNGGFSSGMDTPVVSALQMRADAVLPHVTYCRKLAEYMMVFNINAYMEIIERREPDKSGTYVAFSDDGIHWSEPTRLVTAHALHVPGREWAWHPTIISDDEHGESGEGRLYYAYNPNWGPHYLVGQPISFAIGP